MTEKIMQCCYTNAVKTTGGNLSSGWQAVAVSEHIPPEAYANCVNLQNANSTIQSHMVDEQGNVLNLLEITGDGAYVYVSRTQYGLTDRLGRPNMFSHAYIFSWKQEDILSDPNWFLTLTADNFAQDEESASRHKDALERTAPFTLERALERAGLTGETYLTLIQCVYARFVERKAAKPVFVQYDGSEEQLQAILYCVYCGLPYCVRRNLSVASAASNTTKDHHLIFSTAAASHDSFIVPQTGENNVLTPRTQRRIARYGFVDYAAQNCRGTDMDAYFRRLENLAMELGDSTASDELILKIAHQLIQKPTAQEMSDEELTGGLSDALRSRGYGSQRMEEHISAMLREICRRRLSLTEESDANLDQWLVSPVTDTLADTGEQYRIYVIAILPAKDAARRLHSLPKAVFERYSETLVKSEDGRKILDCYYAEYGLEDKEITWKALAELLAEASYVQGAVMVKERVKKEAWKLYDAQIETPGQAPRSYESLINLMRVLLTPDEFADCGKTAKEHYWDTVTLENFSYRRKDEYEAMRSGSAPCRLFMDLCDVIRTYEPSGEDGLLRSVSRYSNEYEPVFNDPESANDVLETLDRELCRMDPRAEKLSGWIDAVAIPDAKYILNDILALRGQLHRKDYSGLTDAFRHIEENDSISASAGVRLLRIVGETAAEECQANDTPEHSVPLDVWLTLGKLLYPKNIFQIFEEMDLCVLQADEEQVVSQSKLLETSPYAEQAEDYVQSRGKAAKAVHKWLGVLKAADRRRRAEERAEERKQRKETEGSILDRGRAIFSNLTSGGGENKPGRRLEGREASREKDFAKEKGKGKDKEKDRPWGGLPFGSRRSAKRDSERDTKQDTQEKKDPWGWDDED